MKNLKKKIKKSAQKIMASFLMLTTIVWSFGASLMYVAPIKIAEAASAPTAGQVVISEIKVQEGSDATKQFVELYNTTGSDLELNGCKISVAVASASALPDDFSDSVTISSSKIIPAYGYFLFAAANYEPHGMIEDIAGTLNLGTAGGFVALRLGNNTVIDQMGYGTVTDATLCNGEVCALAPGEGSIERKASSTSDSTTMGWGGSEQFLGNGYDSAVADVSGLADFIQRLAWEDDPQKSTSPIESNNFMIMDVMPMGPQMVSVMFNKPIDSATIPADLSTLVTLSTVAADTETITSVVLKNSNELEIYASGANIDGSTGNDTVTIKGTATSGLKATDATTLAGDTIKTIQFYMPPEVMGVKYESDNSVKVIFSKAMEEVSAENASAYGIFVNGAAVTTITNTDLSLDATGKILTITKTGAFNTDSDSSSTNDYIEVNYDFSVAPRDTEGSELMPTFGWQKEFSIDGGAPTVTGGKFNATDKTITVYFSEELDPSFSGQSEVETNYTVSSGCGDKTVRFQESEFGPSFDAVVITCVSDLAATFTVEVNNGGTDKVVDKAQNAVADDNTTNIYTADATTNAPIKIASVSGNPANGSYNMMMDGCMDQYGETGNYLGSGCTQDVTTNRDSLTIVFDGAINPASINYDSTNGIAYNIGSYLEIYEKHSRTAGNLNECQLWEIWNGSNACVEKMMGSLGNSFGVLSTTTNTNDTLTIYFQGWDANVWPGMEVNPIGIMGMNGLTAAQSATADDNRFTMNFAEVEFVKVSGLTQSSTITLFFSGDMTRGDIPDFAAISGVDAKLKPVQHMPYWAEHNWGTGGAVAWGNHNGDTCVSDGTGANDGTADCLKITLGASPTIADKDDIMANGLTDASGMYLGWGGMIDTTALAVSNYTWNSDFTQVTLEFNKMLRDYNATGEPPTPDFTNNTITSSGVGISAKLPVFDTSTGGMDDMMMMDMFKKIKLTFDAVVELTDSITFSNSAIGDENGNIVPDITIAATEDLTTNKIELSVDSVGPVLAQVITNDWNHDGTLNGGDEIIFKFDNDADHTTTVCDVDYSTVSSANLQSDFIVKRGATTVVAGDACPADGTTVANPFGEWINFWVDMWEEHAGELHLNLGPGSDIQAGDIICSPASSNIKDYAGNSLADSEVLAVIKESRDAEISKVVFNNVDNSVADEKGTATNNDTFEIHFSEAIDPYTLGSYDGSSVTNIDWGLGVEFNWEAGYGSTYDAGTMKTWGNATGVWTTTQKLTITLACANSPCNVSTTAGDASIADFDMVMPYGVQTADGAWVNKPGFIDLTKPTLQKVILMEDANSSDSADQIGDKIILIFSEEMNETTLTSDNIGARLVISDSKSLGVTPTVNWVGPGICEVTIANAPTEGTATTTSQTFNPADTVTDLAGQADNTTILPTLLSVTTKPVSSVVLSDPDTINAGVDGRDVKVTWTAPSGAGETYSYDIYLLPDFVPFNPDSDGIYASGDNTHFPVANVTNTAVCDSGSCEHICLSTLMTDSRTVVDTSTGIPESGAPFFPISDWEKYTAYVVAVVGIDKSFPQKDATPIYLTMEYGGGMDNQAPWVENTMPFDGAIVPTNTAQMGIKFSEPMNRTSIETSGNIKLQTCSADCHLENNWSDVSGVYVSYNADHNKAEITLSGDLTPNAKYRFNVTSVEDLAGFTYTGNPGYFRASSGSDTTAPKVVGNSFMFEGKTLTSISRTEPMVGIAFDKDMDYSSFTTTSVSLTPSVPGSDFHYDPMMMGVGYFFGSPLESGQTYTLTLSGVYIKDVSGNTLDGDGSGTAAGTTADNYTLTFTANSDSLSVTAPTVNWVFSDGHHIDVGFSADMNKTSVSNKSNWILTSGSGAIVSLQMSNFDYEPFMNELHIGPIELTQGQNYTLTPSSSVLGMNSVSVDTTSTHGVLTFSPETWDVTFTDGTFSDDMYATGGMFATDGMFSDNNILGFNNMMVDPGAGTHMGAFDPMMAGKMFMDDAYMDHDIKTFMPIDAWPMNQIEGKITNYHIGFPTSKAIPHEGKIVLQFPVGFDLTSAAVAVDEFMGNNQLFFFNQDINGPGGTMDENTTPAFNPAGKVQISDVGINNMDKTLTLTVAVEDNTGCTLKADGTFEDACVNTSATGGRATTMPFDYIDFELSGIKNGSASEIDWRTNTGGYQITITTKDNDNKVLEGGSQNPIKSMKFPIKAAGAGSISGKVTAQDGTTGIANAMVFIDSPMSGPIDAVTGADGTYSVSGLPVSAGNTYDGWYHIHVESPKNDDAYFGGANFDIQLTQSSPTASDKNVRLSSAANTLTVKVTTTADLNGEDIMVWVGGPNGHNEKKFTLDITDDDGNGANGIQNHLDIKVANGDWDVGIHPFFAEAMFMTGPPPPPSFLSPAPKNITVTGNTNVSISLASSVAEYEITGMVKDGTTEKGLSNVHVEAFTHFGPGFYSSTDTRSDGSFTLKVAPGFYQVEAYKSGLPSVPGKSVEIKDASVSGVELIVHKPGKSISGKVTDGTNPIPHAGVNAWDNNGRFIFGETDAEGEFILFVDSSTSWSVEVFAPGFGKLEADASVASTTNLDTTSADVTGINFTASNSNIVTISGTVKDASGNAVEGVKVRADEVAWSGGAEGAMTGKGLSVNTDANGAYTLRVPASTAGEASASTRYRISATNENSGDLTPITGIDAQANVAAASDSKLSITLPTARTITIDVQNAPDNNLLNSDDATDFYIDKAFLNIYSDTSKKGNSKKITDADLSDTSDGTLSVQEGSGYRASLYIPGYGEFEATENGSTGFSVSGSNKTIHFDLKRDGAVIDPHTIEGQVAVSSVGIANAYVSVINETTFEVASEQTDSNGNYKLKVPDKNPDGTVATYKVRVDKDGFSPSAATTGISADKADANFQMTASSSTITGTVYTDADKTVPAANTTVMAKEVGGEGFVKVTTDSNGKFSQTSNNAISVSSDKVWNVVAKSATGDKGQKVNITSGSSDIEIVLTDAVAGKSQMTTVPKTESITPASGGTVDQIDTVGIKLTIPKTALGSSTTAGGAHVTVKETAALPETADFKPLGGIGKEITATEAIQDGKTIDLEFVYKKDKIEAMTETDMTNNNLAPLDQVRNVYWDDNANNYVPLATTRTVETKAAAADEWTPTDWSDFIVAVGANKDTYNDYKITLKSTTEHFTIFGLKVGSDSTAPTAPTGLSQTSGSGTAVVLDWSDNSETDLMEYEVYRSTSSGVTAITANQVNASQVAASAFTDSTTTAWTVYYYTVTAVDDSTNESSTATEIQVCSNSAVSNGTVSSATCAITCNIGYTQSGNTCVSSGGGGGGGGSDGGSSDTGQAVATSSAGGTISKANTDGSSAKVVFPAEALSENATVTVAPKTKSSIIASRPVSSGKSVVGNYIYSFTAVSGTTAVTAFNKAVRLTFIYTNQQAEGFGEENFRIHYWNETSNEWTALEDNVVDTVNNTVTATTTHFTYFTILGTQAETVEVIDGDIIQCETSDNPFAVYIVKEVGDTKYIRHIVSLEIFNYYEHLKWDNLKQVDSLTNYSLSGWARVNTGPNNTPGPNDKVYEINGDQSKHWINMTAEDFLTHGGSDAAIYSVNQGEMDLYTTGPDVMSL